MSGTNIEDVVVRCNLSDGFVNVISESSSKERLEIRDIISGCEFENKKDNNLECGVEDESINYSELFSSLNNKPQNWDLIQYEKFKELCKNVINEIYKEKNTENDYISLKDDANKGVIDNCCKVMLTPLRLLRFLVGFNFNTGNAFTAFSKHIKWRKEFNIDTVVRPFVITNMLPNNNIEMAPLHNTITRYYPCNLLLRESTGEKKPLKDRSGNIICIERFGLLDETRLLGAVKVDELLLWYSYHMEYRSILLDKLSLESKSFVRATCIMDLYGLTVSQVHSSHIITILRRMIQLASDNYPEGMSYVIFVNAPKFFSIVWNSFKSLLAARTVEKILVLDEDYKERLFSIVSINNLPQFLGGLTTEQYSTVPNTGTLLLDCFGLGDDRQTLHIKRMKKERIAISIIKPNTFVYWTWGVLEGEIGFGAKYLIDDMNYLSNSNASSVTYQNSNVSYINKFYTTDNLDIISSDKICLKDTNNSILQSSIQTKNHDVQHEITIVSSSKFDSTKAYSGSYYASVPGYLILQWDNSWSLFSGKTIHFVVKTTNSKQESIKKNKSVDSYTDDNNNNDGNHNNKNNNNCDSSINNNDNNDSDKTNNHNKLSDKNDSLLSSSNINKNRNFRDMNVNIDKDNITSKNNRTIEDNKYILELSNIGDVVSHNVALSTITKRRPSKNHKSNRIISNSIVNSDFLEIQDYNSNAYFMVPVSGNNKMTKSLSTNTHTSKRNKKYKKNKSLMLNDNCVSQKNNQYINKCIKVCNLNSVNKKKLQTDNNNSSNYDHINVSEEKKKIFNESNYSLNSNSESEFEKESSNSECRTNFSYVTAYSVIEDSIGSDEHGSSIVLNSSRGLFLKKDYSNYDKNEFNSTHLSRNNAFYSNSSSYIEDNYLYSPNEILNLRLKRNDSTYMSKSNKDLFSMNRYSFVCTKSIESRVDIYGHENFGLESYNSINRQSFIESYLKLGDSISEGRCFRSSFKNKNKSYVNNNDVNNSNNNNCKKLERLLNGVKKIKNISESLLSKTCSSEKKYEGFNKKSVGIKKGRIECKLFDKIKNKFKTT
ncbi:hypothetical protein FG386_001266 [Cryptosporidium ryanae]|uniref:uncharacterized protein n=1 Tax=Cryptosporidium ryanae TaxID=515981 RepID=UPI00351A8941|nr:hypothetical protein FG386_001266 [Cryptosporidium ryanae]